ncbi:hypothetical protein [Actinocorallia libanotica]|uniref:hypothetical protein n=1 Tax=Actinocorallia libanotica TaxID=46162 RepID=UPI0031CEC705
MAACLLDWHDSPEPTLTASNVVIVRRIGKKTDLIYDGPIILEEDSAPPRLSADETVAYYSAGPSLGHTLVQHLPLGAVAHGRLTYPPDPDYLKETVLIGDWRKTPEGQWRLAGVLLQRPEDET